MDFDRFYDLLKFLKAENLSVYPIRVKRVKMPQGYDGDCKLKDNYFIIRIEKNLPEYYAIDVLLHEISHAVSWDKEDDIHGLTWGKSYSLIYRKFLEWHEKFILKND